MHIPKLNAAKTRTTGFAQRPLLVLMALLMSLPAFAEGDEKPPLPLPGIRPAGPSLAPGPTRLPVPKPPKEDPKEGEGDGDGKDGGGDGKDGGGDGKDGGDDGKKGKDGGTPPDGARAFAPPRQKAPVLNPSARVQLDFVNKPLMDLIKYMAEVTGRNFILGDDIKGDVTIISHKMVSVPAAYEAFLSALQVSGYTTVQVGSVTKVVRSTDAKKAPLRIHQGGNIPFTDNYVTQIIELQNVSVNDISTVVKDLMGKDASVISYAPANTLILTDSATNIRKIYRIISQLDIAAPRAKLHVISLSHADAADVQKIIQELYGTESSGSSDSSSGISESRRRRRSRLRDRDKRGSGGSSGGTATKVGVEGKYIEKIIADERTNSLIVMANEEALKAVVDLITELDVDVDPSSRAQIHVYYLKHAKSEDVAQVLSNLADTRSTDSRTRRRRDRDGRRGGSRGGARGQSGGSGSRSGTFGGTTDQEASAIAAFEDGVRITSDENTNSLVIIATMDQFAILRQVISKLDIRRKQVFVEAVILELASDDNIGYGLGTHMGKPGDDGSLAMGALGLDHSSLGLSPEALSGMAVGIYGTPVTVSVPDPLTGAPTDLSVPAFGIALKALQSNSSVNIVSTPNILTTDNEEAKIVVGRNISFPTSSAMNNLGTPVVSFQREDVAITLKVTPQINESNFVTLEIYQEVSEVEDSANDSGASIVDKPPTTSKRSVETTVVVRDNQTVVLGGLISSTESEVETKVPVLGDLPLLGVLFRGQQKKTRKTNLMIFLTPHVIDGPEDLEEVYRVKWAQRQEYLRRFYGKGRDKAEAQLADLLQFSMNHVDQPSPWRTKVLTPGQTQGFTTIGSQNPGDEPPVQVREVGKPPQDGGKPPQEGGKPPQEGEKPPQEGEKPPQVQDPAPPKPPQVQDPVPPKPPQEGSQDPKE